MIRYRPMTAADIDAHRAVSTRAFDALAAQQGSLDPFEHPAPSGPAARRTRRHLLATDPGGAWVAEDADGAVVGVAMAIVREDVWGLSSLVVQPGLQSAGVGRELLRRALAHGDGGRLGALIVASSDPRALRAYGQAGFTLQPSIKAAGPLRIERPPEQPDWIEPARAGAHDAAMEEVSRAVRGASHGCDAEQLRAAGELHVAAGGERGFVWHDRGVVRLLAARDDDAATALLWRALAATPPRAPAHAAFITGAQQWALRVALDAGLRLTVDGAVCVRGAPGPLAPYLPSGAFL